MKYLILFTSMSLAVAGQFLLKKGINLTPPSVNVVSIIKTIFSPLVFSGFLLYGISSLFWIFVLQKFELSVAYPSLSLTYIAIILISFFFLGEPLGANKIVGILFIILGVFIIFR